MIYKVGRKEGWRVGDEEEQERYRKSEAMPPLKQFILSKMHAIHHCSLVLDILECLNVLEPR